MFGISGGEFLVLLVVGALVLGPKNIAQALHAMRKGVEVVRRWSAGMRAGSDGEFDVAEKELAALRSLDLRQLDPRRIVREAVRDEMEAWMAMAGAAASSSAEGAEPTRDGTNRAARTAERAAYSASAFARADSLRADSKGVDTKRADSKRGDIKRGDSKRTDTNRTEVAAKDLQLPQESATQTVQDLAVPAPQEPAARSRQKSGAQDVQDSAAQVPQERAAHGHPQPNEKSPGEPSAARDSIKGDSL